MSKLRSHLRLLLVATALSTASGAYAANSFAVRQPSASGSFLAGQQAMTDLNTQSAAQFLLDAARDDWDNPALVESAFLALAADGQMDEAADVASHLLEIEPGNELARLLIGAKAVKEARYDDAIAELDKLGIENFAGITGAILQAWAYVGADRYDDATKLLDQLGENGLDEFLVFHRALMAEYSGRMDEALDYAQQAYDSDPLVERVTEVYARMLAENGEFDKAREVIATFEKQGVTHPLLDIVSAALSQGKSAGKFTDDVQTGAAEMFHGIGVALARDGTRDLSMSFLRMGLYMQPNADVIAMALGQLYDLSDQHMSANAIYNAIPATSPLKPTAVVRVAQNVDAAGDRKDAIRRLGNIVATNPGNIDAMGALGDMLRYDEQYAKAAESYTKVLNAVPGDMPSDWRYYYVRGIAYERGGEWPKAEQDFKQALVLSPNQPQVLNYLGYSWVDQGVNLAPALEMIEKAVQASPNDGYIVDSLGWAFYRLGRIEEAVATLEKAVQMMPNDPEINDHLGDAYLAAGRKLEARFQWQIALSVDEPDGVVTKRVQPKLAAENPQPSEEPDDVGAGASPAAADDKARETANEEPAAAADEPAATPQEPATDEPTTEPAEPEAAVDEPADKPQSMNDWRVLPTWTHDISGTAFDPSAA